MKKYIIIAIALFGIFLLPHFSHADTTLQFQRADLFSPALQPNELAWHQAYYNQSTTFNGTGLTSLSVVVPMDINYSSDTGGEGGVIDIADQDTCVDEMGMISCSYKVFCAPAQSYASGSVVSFYQNTGWCGNQGQAPFNFTAGHTYLINMTSLAGQVYYTGSAIIPITFSGGSGGTISPTGGTPASPAPSISFSYPVNDTISQVFDDYQFSLVNVTSTHLYTVNVNEYLYLHNGTFAGERFLTGNNNFTGASSGTLSELRYNNWQIISEPNVIPLNSTSVIAVDTATLLDVTDPNSQVSIAQSSSTWTAVITANGIPVIHTGVDVSGNVTTTSSTVLVVNSNTIPPADTVSWCTKPTDWTDYGGDFLYAGCSVLSLLFQPSSNSINALNVSFLAIAKVPPFAYVFVPLQALQVGAQSAGASSSADLTFSMDSRLPSMVPKTSLTIISATELNDLMGTSTQMVALHNQLFQVEDYVMLLFLIFFCLAIVIKFG